MKYLFSICAIAAVALGVQLSVADDTAGKAAGGKCPLSGKCDKSAAVLTAAVDDGGLAETCSKECAAGKCASGKCAAGETVAAKCEGKCSEGKCAGECAEKCAGKCDKSTATASASEECSSERCESGVCCATLAAAKKQLPQMTYLVGTESVCCAEMAAEKAEKSNEKVQYVVAEKTYCCKEAAFTALVEETEKFVNAFVSPSRCEVSGITKVCGKEYGCCQTAAKQTELVSTAVKAVRMGYKVGDEEVCCVKHASTLAKEKNAPIHYLVDGQETECELSARLQLATAKYIAAVSAMAKSEVKTDTTASLEKAETEESGS